MIETKPRLPICGGWPGVWPRDVGYPLMTVLAAATFGWTDPSPDLSTQGLWKRRFLGDSRPIRQKRNR